MMAILTYCQEAK